MEHLIEGIQKKLDHIQKQGEQGKDGIMCIDLINDLNYSSKEINPQKAELVDLSSMQFNEILHLIKTNQRLLSDYFRYELYKSLTKSEVSSLIQQAHIPSNSLKPFIGHIFTLQSPSDVLLEFISQNTSYLTEEHKLIIIKNSQKLKKSSSIIESITKSSIDISYMMDLVAHNPHYHLDCGILSSLLKIIKKKHKERKDWLMFIRNQLSILIIHQQIDQSDYLTAIKDIEESLSVSTEAEDNEEMVVEGWNKELSKKLLNKKGVILETIEI